MSSVSTPAPTQPPPVPERRMAAQEEEDNGLLEERQVASNQPIPSWYSWASVPVLSTDDAGSVQTIGASTWLVQMPIEYSGPSIPLGFPYTQAGGSGESGMVVSIVQGGPTNLQGGLITLGGTAAGNIPTMGQAQPTAAGSASPTAGGSASPTAGGSASPTGSSASPTGGSASPTGGSASPTGGSASPTGGSVSPSASPSGSLSGSDSASAPSASIASASSASVASASSASASSVSASLSSASSLSSLSSASSSSSSGSSSSPSETSSSGAPGATSDSSGSSHDLSKGEIAGIAIGAFFGFVAIVSALAVCFIIGRRRRAKARGYGYRSEGGAGAYGSIPAEKAGEKAGNPGTRGGGPGSLGWGAGAAAAGAGAVANGTPRGRGSQEETQVMGNIGRSVSDTRSPGMAFSQLATRPRRSSDLSPNEHPAVAERRALMGDHPSDSGSEDPSSPTNMRNIGEEDDDDRNPGRNTIAGAVGGFGLMRSLAPEQSNSSASKSRPSESTNRTTGTGSGSRGTGTSSSRGGGFAGAGGRPGESTDPGSPSGGTSSVDEGELFFSRPSRTGYGNQDEEAGFESGESSDRERPTSWEMGNKVLAGASYGIGMLVGKMASRGRMREPDIAEGSHEGSSEPTERLASSDGSHTLADSPTSRNQPVGAAPRLSESSQPYQPFSASFDRLNNSFSSLDDPIVDHQGRRLPHLTHVGGGYSTTFSPPSLNEPPPYEEDQFASTSSRGASSKDSREPASSSSGLAPSSTDSTGQTSRNVSKGSIMSNWAPDASTPERKRVSTIPEENGYGSGNGNREDSSRSSRGSAENGDDSSQERKKKRPTSGGTGGPLSPGGLGNLISGILGRGEGKRSTDTAHSPDTAKGREREMEEGRGTSPQRHPILRHTSSRHRVSTSAVGFTSSDTSPTDEFPGSASGYTTRPVSHRPEVGQLDDTLYLDDDDEHSIPVHSPEATRFSEDTMLSNRFDQSTEMDYSQGSDIPPDYGPHGPDPQRWSRATMGQRIHQPASEFGSHSGGPSENSREAGSYHQNSSSTGTSYLNSSGGHSGDPSSGSGHSGGGLGKGGVRKTEMAHRKPSPIDERGYAESPELLLEQQQQGR